jgi:hypothetical protein
LRACFFIALPSFIELWSTRYAVPSIRTVDETSGMPDEELYLRRSRLAGDSTEAQNFEIFSTPAYALRSMICAGAENKTQCPKARSHLIGHGKERYEAKCRGCQK